MNILWLAIEGLARKKSRNLLTMTGVLIGVFALTMIVALGQGLSHAVTDTVSGSDNLRQIGLTGGYGIELSNNPADVTIEGEMEEDRRERLRRAAVNRRQIRQWSGRRINEIDDKTIAELSKLPHVESIMPVIVERYTFEGAIKSDGSLTGGLDVNRRRYADRVIAGRYFSADDADEIILHEYMLYKLGLLTGKDYDAVLGKTVTLRSIVNAGDDPTANAPPQLRDFMDSLSDEERAAMMKILPKLMQQFGQMAQAARKPVQREMTIVGVLRETVPGDVFNVIEDGNAVQTDVFMPQETARSLFNESAINRELGYPRALVLVDDPENAPAVEQALRDKGFTAFSVASVLQQVETMLTVITVIIAFLTGIALIVSTLGIVNTMITSVLERTREIGIFKAVGATNWQVQAVFLAESALIGLAGGLAGLATAVLAMIPGDAIAGSLISERAAVPYTGSVFVVPLWLALAGPALGMATAILAAILPARRAARIDPVKALRHD
ncbi:MAG: ABC transporter permease [Planctomycetes bacterium]|nr:ABC transporter permease [Planctomycetota bacterium]MCW8135849.1 ABC transporter permease [Planctomycetota bacterium]